MPTTTSIDEPQERRAKALYRLGRTAEQAGSALARADLEREPIAAKFAEARWMAGRAVIAAEALAVAARKAATLPTVGDVVAPDDDKP